MQERRRRLIKYMFKKEGKAHLFEEGYQESISKKTAIILKFSTAQLEDLLRTSTKNVAQEVVSCLIDQQGGYGLLSDVERTRQSEPFNRTLRSSKSATGPRTRQEQQSDMNSHGLFKRIIEA